MSCTEMFCGHSEWMNKNICSFLNPILCLNNLKSELSSKDQFKYFRHNLNRLLQSQEKSYFCLYITFNYVPVINLVHNIFFLLGKFIFRPLWENKPPDTYIHMYVTIWLSELHYDYTTWDSISVVLHKVPSKSFQNNKWMGGGTEIRVNEAWILCVNSW